VQRDGDVQPRHQRGVPDAVQGRLLRPDGLRDRCRLPRIVGVHPVRYGGTTYCFRTCFDKAECNANRDPENESNCSSNVMFKDPQNGRKACVRRAASHCRQPIVNPAACDRPSTEREPAKDAPDQGEPARRPVRLAAAAIDRALTGTDASSCDVRQPSEPGQLELRVRCQPVFRQPVFRARDAARNASRIRASRDTGSVPSWYESRRPRRAPLAA